MTDLARIQFAKPSRKFAATVVALAGQDLALGPRPAASGSEAPIARAAAAAGVHRQGEDRSSTCSHPPGSISTG